MTIIEGISDQGQQVITVPLTTGSFQLQLYYSLQQGSWFYSISWNGATMATGLRLVTSPNVLQQYINVLPFGILVLANGNVEPTGIEDLVNGNVTLYLLQGSDIAQVAQYSFGAPAGAVQPVSSSSSGSQVIIPPTNWGPASGDLSGAYPGPSVIAIHEGGGQQLTIAPIADGLFLKRVGSQIVGTTPAGVGNVVGPVGATSLNLAAFNGATGTLIQDSGISSASITAAIASALATAETYTNTVATSTLATAHADAVTQAGLAQAASFPVAGALTPGDLTGSMPSPQVTQISQLHVLTYSPIGYATGGAIQIRFDLGSYDHIGITTAGTTTFSGGGSTGRVNGRTQTLDVGNTTGAGIVLAWPGAWLLANGALPTTLAPGAWIRVMLFCTGATEASIVAAYFSTPGGGGGSLPVGGTPYQRLAKNSSSTNDVGWYSGSIVDAADYLANGSTLQAAFNYACSINGCLQLPPGRTALPAGGLVLPNSFQGSNASPASISIKGCGKNVSFLTQANAGPGVSLVPNAPNPGAITNQPGNTFIHLQGFTVVANAACTSGIVVDYGTLAVSSQTNGGNCTFSNLSVTEGSGTFSRQAMYFRNVWYSSFQDLSGLGSYYNGGTTGDGLVLDSCINPLLVNLQFEGYVAGIRVPFGTGWVGNSQGCNFTNTRIIQCKWGFYFVGMDFWVTNFMIDNGNNFIDGCMSIYFDGTGGGAQESNFTCGQILQFGGQYLVELNRVEALMFQGVGMTYISNAPSWSTLNAYTAGQFVQDPGAGGATYKCILGIGAGGGQPHTDATHWAAAVNNGLISEIWLTGNSSYSVFQGNTFAGSIASILADAGTSNSKAYNNIRPVYVDHGGNSLVS